jgi:hypothetical protein
VRDNLTKRVPPGDGPFDFFERGIDGTLDDLPVSLRHFFRGRDGSLAAFSGAGQPRTEERACSKT